MNIEKIIKEGEEALELYCKAYDEKWDYFELSISNIQSGLCVYASVSFKHNLRNAIGGFERCYMYITPSSISSGESIMHNNRYRFTKPYQALLPRIVYLQTLLKELKKIK